MPRGLLFDRMDNGPVDGAEAQRVTRQEVDKKRSAATRLYSETPLRMMMRSGGRVRGVSEGLSYIKYP